MIEPSIIGKSPARRDALEKVTGSAIYTSDVGLQLPGLLWGKVLRSPFPHAKIISIDTSQAERLLGVKVVMTGNDLPPIKIGLFVADRDILARDRVRFIGDAVAAVAADNPETAEEALELIKVEYEIMPAVFDVEEAMSPDCKTVLHPDLARYERPALAYLGQDLPGPNVHTHHKIRRGNVEDGFQQAELIVENTYSTPRLVHCQLEPYNAFAYVESDGTLTIWSSAHQLFSATQQLICQVFGLPPSKVRVRAQYIGGNFGAQPQAERFAALLALKTEKPVRVTYSREECFIDGFNRYSTTTYIKDGVKKDGTLLARQVKVICNGGAYANYVPFVARNGAFALSTYRTPNLKWDAYGIYTNEPCSGPFRGFGSPQVLWTIEQQMDIIAEKLGMDAVDLRNKNIIREGEENIRGETTHSIGAQECLNKVAEWIEWGKPSPQSSGNLRIGKGLALGNKYSIDSTVSAARVKVHSDGIIEVYHGGDEVGQGVNTIITQIVAEEFNTPMDKVRLVWGDTARTPYDLGSASSRTTFNTGNAVRLACQDAKRQMFELAATKLRTAPQDLETGDDKIYVKESPEKAIMVADLFMPRVGCLPEGGELLGKSTFVKLGTGEDPETGQGKTLVAFYIYGAQAAEVAVDTETGQVQVLRFGSAFDMGRPINPKLCEGQMEGGAGMGIGSALYEEMVLDKGQVLNPNFTDYKLPSAASIPSGNNMASMIAAAPQRDGPYGAKGVGEGTMTITAPAIANAIYNAIGVRIRDLPITPEKVLNALRESRKDTTK